MPHTRTPSSHPLQGASKLEFVMTNGENDWDSPGRFSDKPKNYAITAPGAYRLAKGKLERLGDADPAAAAAQ